MFIRAIKKKNKNSSKIYYKHKLVDSVRTPNGPRQKVVLNLGSLDLEQDKWKRLANRIEEMITGQKRLTSVEDKDVENLARHYAKLYSQQKIAENSEQPSREPEFASVDLNAVSSSEAKSIGREYVGLEAMRRLGFPELFRGLGFTPHQINMAILTIVGRLIRPSSEHELKRYAQHDSGLDVLLNTDFSHIGQNALYEISDLLLAHKQDIEQFLRTNTKNLLGLSESIILYDLTNTYFEGDVSGCDKAEHGKSKQKRNDRPQITLGFVLDEHGFLKSSQTFDGNVSEPSTLNSMVQAMHEQTKGSRPPLPVNKPTVVMDAGIASEENLHMLQEQGFSYIVVSKSRPADIPDREFVELKQGVKVKHFQQGNEMFLHCWSEAKTQKEQAMVRKARNRMEKELTYLRDGLSVKGRLKNYERVLERIGKLRKQYSRVSKGFDIQVEQQGITAVDITWTFDESKLSKPYDGTYFLRTDRTDLSPEQLWQIYVMLTTVEDAFRSLKSELGLRPNFHHRSDRIESHIFITVLAYHLLQWIQYSLHQAGLHHRWSTVHSWLDTHRLLTSSLPCEEGGVVHIRHCTTATLKQSEIYSALGISDVPLNPRKTMTQ
jgi:transposase